MPVKKKFLKNLMKNLRSEMKMFNKKVLFTLFIIFFTSCDSKQVEIQYFNYIDTTDNIQKKVSITEISRLNPNDQSVGGVIMIGNTTIPIVGSLSTNHHNMMNVFFKIEFKEQIEMKRIVFNVNDFPKRFFNNVIVYKDDEQSIKDKKIVNQRILVNRFLNSKE